VGFVTESVHVWSFGASAGYNVYKAPASQNGFATGLTLEAGLRASILGREDANYAADCLDKCMDLL
jgi:hypothetical protein